MVFGGNSGSVTVEVVVVVEKREIHERFLSGDCGGVKVEVGWGGGLKAAVVVVVVVGKILYIYSHPTMINYCLYTSALHAH